MIKELQNILDFYSPVIYMVVIAIFLGFALVVFRPASTADTSVHHYCRFENNVLYLNDCIDK